MSEPTPAGARVSPRTVLEGLAFGLVAGVPLALLESIERAVTLRTTASGGWGEVAVFLFVAGSLLILFALLGAAGGVVVLLARAARRRLPSVPAIAWRAIAGAAAAAGLVLWGLFALTLTSRFDPVLARGPWWIGAGALAGALAGAVLPPRRIRGRATADTRVRAAVLALAFPALGLVFVVNVLFAPQSSYGVHVLLDTILVALSFAIAACLPRPRGATALAAALVVFASAVGWTHLVAETRTSAATLVKIRGATSRRAVHLFSRLLDFDRDGWAPAFLVAGWDPDPWRSDRVPDVARALRSIGARSGSHDGDADAPRRAARRAPHVLFLTLDACRLDAVQPSGTGVTPLGTPRPLTPTLDSLRARSATFAAAYSPSSGTEDTFRTLFAGRLLPAALDRAENARWLPERLHRAGWALRAFVNDTNFPTRAWGWTIDRRKGRTREQIERSVEFLADLPPDSSGFVWFHFMEMHASVLHPLRLESYRRQSHLERYRRGLEAVDRSLATLFSLLRERGLSRRTLVVLSADHGEELGEHGHYHHNLSLYEPAVRVPLWLSGPGIVAGERPAVVPQTDLHSTFLGLAGYETADRLGTDLRPWFTNVRRDREPEPIYLFLPKRGYSRRYARFAPERGQAALIDPATGRKAIRRLDVEAIEVYDLREDPGEVHNLWGSDRPWVEPWVAALDSALAANAGAR